MLDALDGADGAIAAAPGGRHAEAGGRGPDRSGTVDRAAASGRAQTPQAFSDAGPARRRRRRRRRRRLRRGDRLRVAGRGAGRAGAAGRPRGAQPEGHDAGRPGAGRGRSWPGTRFPPTLGPPMLTDYHMHLQPDGASERATRRPRAGRRRAATSRPAGSAATWRRARSRAVSEIAITEHVYRFAAGPRLARRPAGGARSRPRTLDAYCEAVLAAREAGLPVLLGVEMDWLPGRQREIAAFLRRPPLRHRAGLGPLARPAGRSTTPRSRTGTAGPRPDVWDGLPRRAGGRRGVGALRRAGPPGPAQGLRRAACPPSSRTSSTRRSRAIAATGRRDRVLVRRPAQAGGRALPRAPPAGALPRAPACRPRSRATPTPREDVARDYPTAVAALRGAGYETITRFSRSPGPAGAAAVGMRVGCGLDAHRFGPGRPLMLGTIAVDHPEGLVGHSDGDVVAHARVRRPAGGGRAARHRRALPAGRRPSGPVRRASGCSRS